MKTLKVFGLFLALFFVLNACRTIRELKAFSRCEFRQKEISKLNVGSMNALNIQSLSDLNFADAGKLALEFKNGTLPLNVTYDIEIRNPNEKTAALEKLDWILELDNKSMVSGTTSERVQVDPSGGLAIMKISTGFDLRKALEKESLDKIINLVSAMKGDNEDQSRIRLKIKPRFIIAGITMGWPGYIKIGKTFKSKAEGEK